MKLSWNLAVGMTGLVLILWVTPGWGQVPPTNDISDGFDNTGGGSQALLNNVGVSNTAYGQGALSNNGPNPIFGTGANNNTAFGQGALSNNKGFANVAVGVGALGGLLSGGVLVNNRGDNNVAVGFDALFENTTGSNNTAVGGFALRGLSSTGSNNTAVGSNALTDNITGSDNTAVGVGALGNNDSGNNNIAIGREAGLNQTSGSDNIYISARGLDGESDTIRLGRNQQQTFIAGIHTVEMSNARTVVINPATLQLGVAPLSPSSARYKRDIETMGTRSQGLLQLRPVTFHYKKDAEGKLEYGLIAEEVAEVYPELVTRSENGEIESVRYTVLIPMLLNELQHQQTQLGAQAEQLNVLKADNERLRAMMAQHRERDEALAVRLERLEAAAASEALASR